MENRGDLFFTLPLTNALDNARILGLKRSGSLFVTDTSRTDYTRGFFIWTWALLLVASRWCRRVKLGGCMKDERTLLYSFLTGGGPLSLLPDIRTNTKIT